jgi:hypothetical protein
MTANNAMPCKRCGYPLGYHRADGNACPTRFDTFSGKITMLLDFDTRLSFEANEAFRPLVAGDVVQATDMAISPSRDCKPGCAPTWMPALHAGLVLHKSQLWETALVLHLSYKASTEPYYYVRLLKDDVKKNGYVPDNCRCGQRYRHGRPYGQLSKYNEEYILACVGYNKGGVGHKVALIGLRSGNRWCEPVAVLDYLHISEEEWSRIVIPENTTRLEPEESFYLITKEKA